MMQITTEAVKLRSGGLSSRRRWLALAAEQLAREADIGAQVRVVRCGHGVSLRALARLLEVSPATLSQIENGRSRLSPQRLARIAAVLDVSVADILRTDPTAVVLPPPDPKPAATSWRHYGPLHFDPVLGAALDEFLDVGYHGATVRGIAARSGLSVPGLYHYYAGKQQLLLSILDYTMTDLLSRAHAARAEGADPVERFSLLVENLALFHTHRAALGSVGASEKRSLDPDNRRRIAARRTAQQRMVDVEVVDAVRLGRFRVDHSHERARAVVTMCTALPTWFRADGPSSPEEIARRYVGFGLDLMRAEPPR